MREISVTKYQAWGGKIFDDRSECEAYEATNPHLIFVGLTAMQIEAALAVPAEGCDMGLAEEFCNIADRIRLKLLNHRPAPPSAPLMPPSKDETPRARGHKARAAGLGHKVPPDLRNDQDAAKEYVEGWTEARAAVELAS